MPRRPLVSCQRLRCQKKWKEGRQECSEDSDLQPPKSKRRKIDKSSPNSILKVRLYPTKEQKQLLRKMFGTHRAIHNKIVEVSRDDCYKLSLKELNAKYPLIAQKHLLAKYLPEYHLNAPSVVMISTYRDFVKALDSSKAEFGSRKDKKRRRRFLSLAFSCFHVFILVFIKLLLSVNHDLDAMFFTYLCEESVFKSILDGNHNPRDLLSTCHFHQFRWTWLAFLETGTDVGSDFTIWESSR